MLYTPADVTAQSCYGIVVGGLIHVCFGFFFTSLISLSLYFRICRSCVKYKKALSTHIV